MATITATTVDLGCELTATWNSVLHVASVHRRDARIGRDWVTLETGVLLRDGVLQTGAVTGPAAVRLGAQLAQGIAALAGEPSDPNRDARISGRELGIR